MKKNKPKNNDPFKGKSNEYVEGYSIAEEYLKYLLEGGNNLGSAPFRVFVEATALSIKRKDKIGQERVKSLGLILNNSEFNKGVYDLLVKKINEYNIGDEADAVP